MSTTYRKDIDGLRAIAVSLVVLNHAFPRAFPGGYVGVDIFFVISGFLITGLILADLNVGRFSLVNFYQRRIRRIFPALILVLGVVCVWGWIYFLPNELISLGRSVVASALFSANILLLTEVDYFDVSARLKPLLHIWSLGVEEQFYIAWPLLLALFARLRISVGWLIFGTIAASLCASIILTRSDPSAAFYLPFTRAWELAVGAALYCYRNRISQAIANRWVNCTLATVGLVAILAPAFVYTERTEFPGYAAAAPATGAALLIAAPHSFINRRLLSTKFAVFVGLISYPLYLWHWPTFVFADIMKGRSAGYDQHLSDLESTGCIVVAVLLAWLTYRALETPIRRNPSSFTVPALSASAVAVAISGVFFVREAGFQNESRRKFVRSPPSFQAATGFDPACVCFRHHPT